MTIPRSSRVEAGLTNLKGPLHAARATGDRRGAVPGSVLGPISQVHVTLPLAVARALPSPCDSLM